MIMDILSEIAITVILVIVFYGVVSLVSKALQALTNNDD
jgi:cell division protein FtsX